MPSPHPTPSSQQEQNYRHCPCLPCRKRPYGNKDEDCCCCSTAFFTNGRADHFPTNRVERHKEVVTSLSCDNVSCVRIRKRSSRILTRRRSASSPPRTSSWTVISGLAFLLVIMMSSTTTVVVLAIPPPPLLPSDSGGQSTPPLHPPHNNSPSSPNLRLAETTVIDVHESETYDPIHQTWVGGSPNNPSARWTTSVDDMVSLPPPSLTPPSEEYEFTSDWKIDVTGSRRDVYGWEYFVVDGVGVRRRRWLRTVGLRQQRQQQQSQQQQRQPHVSARSASVASSSSMHKLPHREEKLTRSERKARRSDKRKRRKGSVSTGRKTTTRPRFLLPMHRQTLKSIRDNWNFKGYGWSIYKSFIFPSSFGLAFRVPLSINFDWYERHPGLPSFTSSFGMFYPFMVVCFLNVSLPLELIRFMFWEVVVRVWRIVYVGMVLGKVCIRGVLAALTLPIRVLWVVVRTLVISTLFFRRKQEGDADGTPATEGTSNDKQAKESTTNAVTLFGHVIPPLPPRRPIRYSTDIQERLGMSISWRYSQKRGYEFRISYWYAILPTIIAWGDVLGRIWDILVPTNKQEQQLQLPVSTKDESNQISVTAANSTSMEASAVTDDDDSTTNTATSIATTSTGRGSNNNKGKGFFRDENAPLTDWLRRRTGSLGVSTGGPIPDYPHVSCSALLSLSGFYYGNNLFKRIRSGSGNGSNKRSTGATAFLPRRNEEEQEEKEEGQRQKKLERHRDGRTKRTDKLSENNSGGGNEMDNIVKETEEETEQELKEKEKRVGG